MKTVMYAHGGSKNHGCEAIVRTTAQILKEIDEKPILLSYNAEEDCQYNLNEIVEIRQELNNINKKSFGFIKAYFVQKVCGNYHEMDSLMHKKAFQELPNIDVAFFIGGDNYCYSDVKNYRLINNFMEKRAKKLVLWGTSVEPELLKDKEICEDIKRFDYIIARESISYEALKKVNSNTMQFPDPAFFLQSVKVKLPSGFQENNTVGINVSPLIIECEREAGYVLKNYEKLVQHIIDHTSYAIALIPHVVWEGNDDRKPLQYLYSKYRKTNRMILVEDHNCMQQKYIISQCKIFVGARTHATIAAYSTGVPTLAIGYSVKARGIAKDLFGTEEKYVIPVQEMKSEDELTKAFQWMDMRKDEISNKLVIKMKEYQKYQEKYLEGIKNGRTNGVN